MTSEIASSITGNLKLSKENRTGIPHAQLINMNIKWNHYYSHEHSNVPNRSLGTIIMLRARLHGIVQQNDYVANTVSTRSALFVAVHVACRFFLPSPN